MAGDDALYSLFLSGDTAAYDELLLRHGDSLTRYLYGYLHHWEDAEDLMVEAFARIMVKKPKIRQQGFKAYLFRTGRNLAARFHTRSTRLECFSLEGMEKEVADAGLSPEENLQQKERREALHLCLQRIEPDLAEALWLVYGEGLSYEEAAAVMGVSRKRVDKLLQRGKGILRTELLKEGIADAHE